MGKKTESSENKVLAELAELRAAWHQRRDAADAHDVRLLTRTTPDPEIDAWLAEAGVQKDKRLEVATETIEASLDQSAEVYKRLQKAQRYKRNAEGHVGG